MKTQSLMSKSILTLMLATTVGLAHASEHEIGNGGDMCENRIKVIRDDMASWIGQGGPARLELPSELSVNRYDQGMLTQIEKAKISCTQDRLYVGSAEKTCKNYVSSTGQSRILCNISRFVHDTSESDQYVLIHHEYAGLAGFEVNDGESSKYTISNQLSGFLLDQVVKKLSIAQELPISSFLDVKYVHYEQPKRVCKFSLSYEGETNSLILQMEQRCEDPKQVKLHPLANGKWTGKAGYQYDGWYYSREYELTLNRDRSIDEQITTYRFENSSWVFAMDYHNHMIPEDLWDGYSHPYSAGQALINYTDMPGHPSTPFFFSTCGADSLSVGTRLKAVTGRGAELPDDLGATSRMVEVEVMTMSGSSSAPIGCRGYVLLFQLRSLPELQ
jgi:hypothetical protein